MKKTLVALAVLAAGSAQASINLYDSEGVSVSLSGAAEVQFAQRFGDDQASLRMDDGDLAVNTTVGITSQVDAIAGLAFEMESGNVTNDELWVGFGGDFGALTFGRQYLIADDAGNGKDYELGKFDFANVAAGTRVIKYVYDSGMFYVGASALIEGEDDPNTDPTVFDGRVGARFGDLDARVYFYMGEDTEGVNADFDAWSLEVDYNMGPLSLAAGYVYSETDAAGTKTEVDCWQVAAGYTMNSTTFQVGYSFTDPEGSEEENRFYGNVTQQLHDNVIVYAEIGDSDADFGDGEDFGYLAGMEVKF